MGAEQRDAQEQMALVHAGRALDYRGMLEPGEAVHDTGLALNLVLSALYGPGTGGGVLLATNARLIWTPEEAEGGFGWPRFAIRNAETQPCPLMEGTIPRA